jgi:hypothetical protein
LTCRGCDGEDVVQNPDLELRQFGIEPQVMNQLAEIDIIEKARNVCSKDTYARVRGEQVPDLPNYAIAIGRANAIHKSQPPIEMTNDDLVGKSLRTKNNFRPNPVSLTNLYMVGRRVKRFGGFL